MKKNILSVTVDHFANACLIHQARERIGKIRNSFSPGHGRGGRGIKGGIREENVGPGFIPCLNRQLPGGCPTYDHPFKIIDAKVIDVQLFSLLTYNPKRG